MGEVREGERKKDEVGWGWRETYQEREREREEYNE